MNWKELEAWGAITIGLIGIFLPFILILSGFEIAPYEYYDSGQVNSICYALSFVIGIIFLMAGIYDYKKLERKEKKEVIYPIQKDRYCPNCGRSIPIDSRICPYCAKNFW